MGLGDTLGADFGGFWWICGFFYCRRLTTYRRWLRWLGFPALRTGREMAANPLAPRECALMLSRSRGMGREDEKQITTSILSMTQALIPHWS